MPEGHKFPMRKYRMVRELVQQENSGLRFEPAPLADPATIKRAHDPAYVDAVLRGTLDAAAIRRIGFPYSQRMVDRSLASVGGTLAATRMALDVQRWGGTLAGGTHHAFRGEGAGFCVFNDIAVAILWAREQTGIARAAVIDLDVHQGDGTAQIFQDDAAVLTTSIHCKSNFPFRKQRSSIDIEMEPGTGDELYLTAVDALLPRIADFRPGILFYQSGSDGLATDALGHLKLTHAGLQERDRRVFRAAMAMGVPLVITQGGGYSKPIEHTVRAHANTYLLAHEMYSGTSTGL